MPYCFNNLLAESHGGWRTSTLFHQQSIFCHFNIYFIVFFLINISTVSVCDVNRMINKVVAFSNKQKCHLPCLSSNEASTSSFTVLKRKPQKKQTCWGEICSICGEIYKDRTSEEKMKVDALQSLQKSVAEIFLLFDVKEENRTIGEEARCIWNYYK